MMFGRAAFNEDDFEVPDPGMGLPNGWAVYAVGPGTPSPPDPPPLSRRCEAATVVRQMVIRCRRERAHDGSHMVRP